LKTRSRFTRGFLIALGIVAGLAFVGIAGWQWGVRPAFEAAVLRATGWKTDVGGLQPGWRRLVARNVTLRGAPPFEQATLARIGRLEVELGGSLWRPRPTLVTLDGAVITYLATGIGRDAVDNVRGHARKSAAGAPSQKQELPVVRVVRSRFEGFLRFDEGRAGSEGRGESLAIRSDRMEATRQPDGTVEGHADGVVADLLGAITARVQRLEASRRGTDLRLSAGQLAVVVPGAGDLLAAETFALTADRGHVRVMVKAGKPADGGGSETRPAAGTLDGTMDVAWAQGLVPRGDLVMRTVPMTALAPLLRKAGISVAAGLASLEVHVRPPASGEPGSVAATVAAHVTGLDVHHPRLDRVPWTDLDVALEASGTFQPRNRRVEVNDGAVTALGLSAGVSGWLSAGPALAGELRISPPPKTAQACAEAFAKWPAPLRTRLSGMIVSGRLGATGRLRFDRRNWDDLELSLGFAPVCQVVAEPTAIANLREGKTPPTTPETVQLAALPRHVVGAFLTAEDGGFRRHAGFDLEMIRLAHDLAMGTLSKGASTLSQQVAKNLFLGPERTIARKLAELVLTWRLETVVGKDRILELYLNVVELGPNLRGLGAASLRYFGKSARDLSPLEAAHLASLLPNPVGFARRFREGRIDDGWLHKLYDLLGRMQRSGYLSAAEVRAARAQTLALRKL
jgi:hypothetical protein